MATDKNVHSAVITKLKSIFDNFPQTVQIPPPVFTKMDGEVIEFDDENKLIKIVFPVYSEYSNPFGNMQGGMIAAAIDNTFGPLSMLIAPPNYTRELEIKYRKTIHQNIGQILVTARFVRSDKRRLFFTASVSDNLNNELAIAKATHWIID